MVLNTLDSLLNRVGVANSAAAGLSTTSWVDNGLSGGSGVCVQNQVNNNAGSTVAWRHRSLASAKDVNTGTAALAFLKYACWRRECAAEEKKGSSCLEHIEKLNR
ncbi:hypothetical protein VC83_00103 [Pseudogymnoascus destructans]|uniref:Uncharacterized protein n=1 Tax=Pseudogymnoascus destructans TaxID=655981 RepID=A0A177ANM8_9PEZI|nr:uncharacterized protein VC83_00103 [Pseudogymnoascus destructans]OAF63102.1 hypothetical protein VC83_00103 [Pseudogymnoascus destructans]